MGSPAAAKAARIEKVATPQAGGATLAKHHGQAEHAAVVPHVAQHAQVVPHRPPTAMGRQAGPVAHGRAPARAEQPGKKKKPDGPGGGQ